MGQSFALTYIHFVFSTKHRKPLILPPVEEELHRYIGGICRNLNSPALKIGGYTDHIHILSKLSTRVSPAELMAKVKANSSNWIKQFGGDYKNFYWQDGYGAFSVYYRGTNTLIDYIANQHEHHSKESYQEEFVRLLKENAIEFDERYLWD